MVHCQPQSDRREGKGGSTDVDQPQAGFGVAMISVGTGKFVRVQGKKKTRGVKSKDRQDDRNIFHKCSSTATHTKNTQSYKVDSRVRTNKVYRVG